MLRRTPTGMRGPAVLLLAALLASCGTPHPSAADRCPLGDSDGALASGGQTRAYRLFVPPGYRPGKALPLVLGFHGNGGTGAGFEGYSGFSALAASVGFIAIYPEGLGQPQGWDTWAGSQDVQFVRDLVDAAAARCAVDPRRIYAVGHSRGGGMANRLGCDLADRFAAVAGVSGAYEYGEDCSPARPVPVIAFHGVDDPAVPYNGVPPGMRQAYFIIGTPIPQWAAAWAERDGCAADPAEIFRQGAVTGQAWSGCRGGAQVALYTVAGGGHEWPAAVDAARIIWEFFAAHPLP